MNTIRKNRARMFQASLETLKASIETILPHLDYELNGDSLTPEDAEQRANEIGDPDEAIRAFDDALEYVIAERNNYALEAELDVEEASYKVKES
jgi:hypothetical protein